MSKATDQITELAKTAADELIRFDGGKSNAAGTRARKALQDIKHIASEERKRIQDARNNVGKTQAA